jgi:hypothetical protein
MPEITPKALFSQHATVVASSTDIARLSTAAAAVPTELRPDLNGLQVKLPNSIQIYLVDSGYKRLIPDPTTYTNLFVSGASVVVDIDIDEITTGVALATGAVLAKASNSGIYVIDSAPNGTTLTKRLIPSPDVLSAYQFSLQAVITVPVVVLAAIPDGPAYLPPS